MLKHLNLKSTKKQQKDTQNTRENSRILSDNTYKVKYVWREYNIYIYLGFQTNSQSYIYIYIYKQRYTTLHVQDEVTNSTNIINNNIYKY